MGDDLDDLVEEVERAFGVVLDPAALAQGRTIGDLCEAVLAALPRPTEERCLTALAFWRLRVALGALDVPHAQVRPDAALDGLLWPRGAAPARRRAAWRRLEAGLGLPLPPLVLPPWLVGLCLLLCAGLFAGAMIAAFPDRWAWRDVGPAWFVALGATAALALLLLVATLPLRSRPALGVPTAGGLAEALVVREPGRLAAPLGGVTRRQVEWIVPRIVSAQLAVPLERLTLDTAFVADLGVD